MKNLKELKGINSEKLKYARKEKGWKIKDLSRETGLTESAISLMENNRVSPNVKTARLLAETLNISVDWLMDIPIRDVPEIVNIYNDLSNNDQKLLLAIAKFMEESIQRNEVTDICYRIAMEKVLITLEESEDDPHDEAMDICRKALSIKKLAK